MRLALIGTAVVLCAVAAHGCAARRHHGPPRLGPQPVAQAVRFDKPRAARDAPPPPSPRPAAQVTNFEDSHQDRTWTVSGWGKTVDDAQMVALEEARKKVGDYLDHQRPPIHWRPSTDFVKGLNPDWSKPELKDLPDLGPMFEQTLTVKLDAGHYKKILDNDRRELAEQRHLLLGKVLAGVLAVLLAVFGYFRLEEMTRGYYTLWLRLGAIALVCAAGALLLVIA